MKRLIVFLLLSFMLVACSNNPNAMPYIKPKSIPPQEEVKKEEQIKAKGLVMNVDIFQKGEKIITTLSIVNTENKEIPLNKDGDKMAQITVKKENKEVFEKMIQDKKRIKLNPLEKLEYKTEIEGLKEGSYEVLVSLDLKDDEKVSYKKEQLTAAKTVLFTEEVNLIPGEERTYEYKDEDLNFYKETFQYFDGDKVQSYSELTGTNVYEQSEKGLFLLYRNKEAKKPENNLLENIDKNNPKTLLGFPLKKGTKWKVDGVTHQILSIEKKIKTSLGSFDDMIEVVSYGKEKNYYYYHKEYGLLAIKKEVDGKLITVLELYNIY